MFISKDFVTYNIIPLYTIREWKIILYKHLKWKIGYHVNEVVGNTINTSPATMFAYAINDKPNSFRVLFLNQVSHNEYINNEQKNNGHHEFRLIWSSLHDKPILIISKIVTMIVKTLSTLKYVCLLIFLVKNTATPMQIRHTKIDIMCVTENNPTGS